jgi:hypothetical protein
VTSSESRSTSVTSIMAIRLHYKQLCGLLGELGFDVPESRFTGMLEPIEAGDVGRVEFLGINKRGQIELALSMHIDWTEHMIVVKSGDSVRLPMRDGSVYLQQVRDIAEEFMKVFSERRLTGEFRAFYRPDLSSKQCTRLNKKYGFSGPSRKFTWASDVDSLTFTSRYHKAVSFGIEVARPSRWY